MSRSRKLQLHIAQMVEIRSILNSMKQLALIETHKLARFQLMQGQSVANIENAALDFLSFYPFLPAADDCATRICILMGSERGFCGDFNERLMASVATLDCSGLIVIGSRLYNRLSKEMPEVIAKLAGANVAEEVPTMLDRLIDTISSIQNSHGFLILTAVYHDFQTNRISQRQILPPFLPKKNESPPYGHPPITNMEPADFFSELIDHYLFAVLHEIFYISLMAENQRRLQHLEGAVKHLDAEKANLHRKSQIYRQEEITEEIEVILLNADNR